ncbi:MAG: N-acetyltransferase [Candidatus Viridilinea halotolerans]|uniref:N-acetyltransferase n=1 Tax=Candidatus Viridilinea halotolerans TaxID=2491704 RepID=A0A426TSH5_9CHLR|nr:MAG: N-acetyltransferase [Candidatus Viridilinea halotolerans]
MEVFIPTLETARLHLRAFALSDSSAVERLAGAAAIADTTLNIPHPYPQGAAADWIASHSERAQRGNGWTWAITTQSGGELLGAIGLSLVAQHQRGEMGYWMGQPFWNQGYTSEAAVAVLHHAFTIIGINRIYAYHFVRNPASGRVMQKIGMQCEGCQRQHVRKGDRFEDLIVYAVLRENWVEQKGCRHSV